ncbi:hypothetical protein PRIPAC_85369 [Pristionchus pacificus]|uniref:Uncharacterized protein n=1 Tax=Pristionchus pacificus TaxID=54126 RepID=A0A2A6BTA8_PRIPA|nr:hypothetical protein PRIPAC_85369 [Pristionchus pacificus]|eukprot:PDM69212.1 hypothetical protein PRIPAC_47514 [Pristionchus pacificus]
MVIPSSSRAAGVALSRLVAGIVSTPSAQIIGFISDAIRGDSTLPYDKFHAYQLGMLSSAVFLVVGAVCHIVLILFFPQDCAKGRGMGSRS